MNRNLFIGIFAAALLGTGTARAADIVNNLSASSTNGYDITPAGFGRAQSFQNGPSDMAFTNLSLVLIHKFGFVSAVNVQLRADSGGSPGAIIETVTASFEFTNVDPTTYNFPANGTNILVANTKYWIALNWVAGDGSWRYTTTTNSTGSGTMLDADAYTFNNGVSWGAGNPNEVFKMAVRGAQLDFGDAPSAAQSGFAATYPVTNGARHLIGGPVLGSLVDGENAGVNSAGATSDDTTTSDDEDGVTFGTPVGGYSATMTVTVSSVSGRLDAWVDWNRDGSWVTGEQIVTNRLLSIGTTPITFNVPATDQAFTNYARFRISTAGALSPTGLAADGEVEDHQLFVQPGPATRYVSLTGSHTYPFTNWLTAATTIQAAVDAAVIGEIVLVTNGTYQTGGRTLPSQPLLTNRVVVDKPIPVRSVNGPALTIIKGAGPIGNAAIRCVYLANGASLSGFTLTNGATLSSIGGDDIDDGSLGGGIYAQSASASVSNCVFTGNSSSEFGGGIYGGTSHHSVFIGNKGSGAGFWLNPGTLNNCTLIGNSGIAGGGAYFGTLNNCTLTGNSAGQGGGALAATLNNCIVYFNTATIGSNHYSCAINYSCTAPHPGGSFAGNTDADPLFENRLAGNFRLTANSPCRNTGNNAAAVGATDLDSNARTNGPAVDMGAFEYTDTDGDALPGWWETLHGLNPAASNTPAANADADGYTDLDEYIADTNPTNPASYFPRIALTNPPPDAMSLVISNTSPGRIYFALGTTNLIAPQTWTLIPPELPGTGTNLVLTIPATNTFRAHRTGVRLP